MVRTHHRRSRAPRPVGGTGRRWCTERGSGAAPGSTVRILAPEAALCGFFSSARTGRRPGRAGLGNGRWSRSGGPQCGRVRRVCPGRNCCTSLSAGTSSGSRSRCPSRVLRGVHQVSFARTGCTRVGAHGGNSSNRVVHQRSSPGPAASRARRPSRYATGAGRSSGTAACPRPGRQRVPSFRTWHKGTGVRGRGFCTERRLRPRFPGTRDGRVPHSARTPCDGYGHSSGHISWCPRGGRAAPARRHTGGSVPAARRDARGPGCRAVCPTPAVRPSHRKTAHPGASADARRPARSVPA